MNCCSSCSIHCEVRGFDYALCHMIQQCMLVASGLLSLMHWPEFRQLIFVPLETLPANRDLAFLRILYSVMLGNRLKNDSSAPFGKKSQKRVARNFLRNLAR